MYLQKTYTPANVDTDAIVDGATGATTPLALNGVNAGAVANDGLAHQLNLTSAANLSGITFTIVGTDENGFSQTEAIAGPNNNTVETTKYFLTVTSIAISATLGANTVDIGFVDEFATPIVGVCSREQVSITVSVTGTIDYTAQHTLTKLESTDTIKWLDSDDDDMVATTTSESSAYVGPITGVRLIANSYTNGATLVLDVLTARGR